MPFLRQFLFALGSIVAMLLAIIQADAQSCTNGRYRDSTFARVDTVTVTYGSNQMVSGMPIDLKAIIYSPNGDTATQRPIVLVLFGGSFVSGNRFQWYVTETCIMLAKRGYVAAAIDYRIGVGGFSANELYKTVYRSQQDALSATRYMRRNAVALGIRPDLVYLWGFSAGAICSLQCAYLQQDEMPAIIDTTVMGSLLTGSGNAGYSNMIRGVISNAGGLGDTNWIKGTEQVKVASIHNSTDGTVSYNSGPLPFPGSILYGSNAVHKRLNRFNIPNSLHTTYSQSMHLPQIGSPYVDTFATVSSAYLYNMVCQDFGTIIPTTLGQTATQQAINIYPNPSTDQIRFAGLTQPVEGQLSDLSGKVVARFTAQPDQPLLIDQLRPGLYHYLFMTSSGPQRGKFMKQ